LASLNIYLVKINTSYDKLTRGFEDYSWFYTLCSKCHKHVRGLNSYVGLAHGPSGCIFFYKFCHTQGTAKIHLPLME